MLILRHMCKWPWKKQEVSFQFWMPKRQYFSMCSFGAKFKFGAISYRLSSMGSHRLNSMVHASSFILAPILMDMAWALTD